MMRMSRPITILSCVVLIGGCTQYWAKPGGTAAEFDATKAACNSRSYSQFPPAITQVMLTAGYTTPMQTICNPSGYGSVSCYTTGGNYMPPVYMPVDQNQGARNDAARSCLYSAGWVPVKDKAEAEAVTNSLRTPVAAASPKNVAAAAPGNETCFEAAYRSTRSASAAAQMCPDTGN